MNGEAVAQAGHVPVLLDEVLRYLQPRVGGVIVDGTFGVGGYSRALLEAGASVVAIDRDPAAIAGGQSLVQSAGARMALVEGRFSRLDEIAREQGYERVDGVVLDVGVSSMQLDTGDRGFSFSRDGPLDMRMGRDGPTAGEVINSLAVRDLARIIAVLGEERKAGAVARMIARVRATAPIARTGELAAIVERAVGGRRGHQIHPATRTFQALRIYVNEELTELADGLAAAERILGEGGRLVVVSFHSLEDRIVKRFLAERSATVARGTRHRPAETVPAPTFRLVTRRPVSPSVKETARNPRARSARLRAAARTDAPARPGDHAAIGVPQFGVEG